MTDIIPKPLSYDYTLTVRTAQLLDVLVNLFKDGSKKERTKVNSWLNANTRNGFSLSINDNFFLKYLDQRDGRGSQHYWSISFNQCYAISISQFVTLKHEWQGLTLRSLPELKLAQLLYQHRIPFLTNTKGLMLPQSNTLSDTVLSGRVEFDFLLLKPLLRIELDGLHHLNPQQRQLDISGDLTLLSLGIPTIRFNATDVLNHPDVIIQEVLQYQ